MKIRSNKDLIRLVTEGVIAESSSNSLQRSLVEGKEVFVFTSVAQISSEQNLSAEEKRKLRNLLTTPSLCCPPGWKCCPGWVGRIR
ncbi:MAG: hypothetical protein ABII72_00380 [Parcubacteria group bacterium]